VCTCCIQVLLLVYSQWCIAKMEVGICKGAWQRAWRYPAYLWSQRWVYAVKKTRRLVYGVYPPIHHCLFLTTVTQLLLIAKHWVSVIVISHRPKYWQTAATHNKFPETFPNIKFPENLHPSHGSLPLPALSENKVRVTIFQTVATQSHWLLQPVTGALDKVS